ncbi:MAG: pirin family protein [Candidatus Woesearchaeota archaeon]
MKKTVLKGYSTSDGAGVKLYRVFANDTVELTDPFLLLDNFGSDNLSDYIKGFPWHPHRGIETVTYMLDGAVEHEDSLGNKGIIGPGDIQWMSAGSGIIHQEMPQVSKKLEGFQLWVNMPKAKKMMTPKYRGIIRDSIPVIEKDGVTVKVISGKYGGKTGPVKDLVIDVEYFDIYLEKNMRFHHDINFGYTLLCYVYEGVGIFEDVELQKGSLILIRDGKSLDVHAKSKLKYIMFSGLPLKERVAWGGPIVMNTEEELAAAFKEIRQGTFIKINNKQF